MQIRGQSGILTDSQGVLSVGIFAGLNGPDLLAQGSTIGGAKPVMAYFGMADGSVQVRKAEA